MLRSCVIAAIVLISRAAAAQPVVPTYDDWTGYDDHGWPIGITLDEVRTLPACPPGLPMPRPGEQLDCRPPVPTGFQWALNVDWLSGWTAGVPGTIHGTQGLGVELDLGLSRAIQLAARYELLGVGLQPAGDDNGADAAQLALAGLRYRAFADEADRDGWTLGLGGGYAFRSERLGGDEPVARASLGRELGLYITGATTMRAEIELSLEQGLGDPGVRSLLLAWRGGFETGIRAPRNLGEPIAPRGLRYHAGAEVHLPLGFGVDFEAGFAGPWSVRATAFHQLGLDGHEVSGYRGALWGATIGPRLDLGAPGPAPLYLAAAVGAAAVADAPEPRYPVLATGELGFHFLGGCTFDVELGAQIQAELTGDERGVSAGFATMRVNYGQRTDRTCIPVHDEVFVATKPLPPPPPPSQPPPPTYQPPQGRVDVVVTPPPPVVVEVHPIVIDVELGVSLLGGAVQIAVDPRLLPLDRLRGAGFVELAITGPGNAVNGYAREVTRQLGTRGIRPSSVTVTATGDVAVHARFTIWPPGTHP